MSWFAGDLSAGALGSAVDDALARLVSLDAVGRLLARDHTLWRDDPTEIADRLGWLDGPAEATDVYMNGLDVARSMRSVGNDRVVVSGMGGSSLFPTVVASMLPTGLGGLRLHVLDSTHPAAVARAVDLVADGAAVVVSSKSGTTIETRAHAEALWASGGSPMRWTAVTDEGSDLEALARERQFDYVMLARSDVGGRFSAFTAFGMVPAAFQHTPPTELFDGVHDMTLACQRTDVTTNPAARLGAVMAAGAQRGRNKLTLLLPPAAQTLGGWIEQLVAESTGKDGTGVLPVVGEARHDPGRYGEDRLFVVMDPAARDLGSALAGAGHPVMDLVGSDGGTIDVGAEVYRWEVATALCCALLGVNAFDQPDVAAAKAATAAALDGELTAPPGGSLAEALAALGPGGYLSVCGFVDPDDAPSVEALRSFADAVSARHGVATTVGIGPRFLHSTGQLHKGGFDGGVFVQVVDAGDADLDIPEWGHTFGHLLEAQADGDLAALVDRKRPVARVSLDELAAWI